MKTTNVRRIIVLLLAVLLLVAGRLYADVIIDNGVAGTSSTGTWQASGAASAYGANSLWSYKGATYTWSFTPTTTGVYRASMWWTALSSRYASVPVVVTHSGGTANLTVNQQTNGGQWNSLGEYLFNAGTTYRVTLTATPPTSPPSTCADAVRFELVSAAPTATIDSITPNPAEPGTAVQFTGHGTDTAGAITAWEWSSNIDGALSTEVSFVTSTLSNGTHTISFRVKNEQNVWSAAATQTLTVGPIPTEVIIDNGQTGTSSTGTWQVSGTSGAYGVNSLWSYKGATYTWSFKPARSGAYNVSMWWTAVSTRYASVPVAITHNGGTANRTVDQRTNGGKWNSLGEYQMQAGTTYSVRLTAMPTTSPPSTCADAVRFSYIPSNTAPQAFIDSIEPNVAEANEPVLFTGHGEDSDGTIAAYIWKVDDVNQGIEPNFVTDTLPQGLHTVSFAVQDNGGVWSQPATAQLKIGNAAPEAFIDSISPNPAKLDNIIVFTGHGTDSDGNVVSYKWETDAHGDVNDQPSFSISAASLGAGTYTVTFRSQDDKGAWSAPITQLLTVGNVKPTAHIDSITPAAVNVGQNIAFTGHGADVDGSIISYSWDSSIDGHLSDAALFSTAELSLGDHIISFTVTDNDGGISEPNTKEVIVNETPVSVIIDNGQSGTSFTGTWQASGAAGFYGTNSLWSYNGATYTWSFTPTISTVYRISMWWTALSTRSNSVPVRITHSGGTTNLTVNQRTNGGQWNNLGEYVLNAGTAYSVRITAPSGSPPSTCADAVKFEKMGVPSPPIANFIATPTTGGVPLAVQFTDNSLGIITSRLWDFGDGTTSTETNPTHTYAAIRNYTVSLIVTNVAGSDTETKNNYIEAISNYENIYVCGIYSWNNGLIIYTESMLQSIGATRIGTDRWTYAARGRTYFINMVRTVEGMVAALKEEGSHVVVAGHSNFGFGAVFATSNEFRDQEILDIRYVDDDRFVQFSSDMVSVKPDGMKYGQAYPNWTTNRKDGTSAVMPYTFAEAKAKGTLPPYNYYMTYKRPGDPNVYKTELSNGTSLQRFPDSGVPAWYSPTGTPPDPCKNPEYFIINDDPDYNRFETVGTWPFAKVIGGGYMGEAGYLGYNYQYHDPGTGSNKAIWTSYIRFPGLYAIMASWFPSPLNATNARYTIHHTDIGAGDTTVVDVNQQVSAPLVNLLTVVYLTPGSYTVELSDAANGRVCADALVVNPLGNPQKILTSEFRVSPQSGATPLTVNFTSLASSYSLSSALGGIKTYHWNFGDGTFSNLPQPSHTYNAVGKYTVSLTVSDDPNDPNAAVTETKTNFITVGQEQELRAEFTAPSRFGPDKTNVYFEDQSTGTITNWHWDFGDGATSDQRSPLHVYAVPGPYTVSLTVKGPDGESTETETAFVYNLIGLIFTDNTFIEKPHYYSRSGAIVFGKLICDTSGTKIPNEDMKYARLFMGSCNSANYFTGAFNRAIYFCTTADIYEYTAKDYLKDYLYRGWSDAAILQHMNEINPGHEYVNFNLKPPSMR